MTLGVIDKTMRSSILEGRYTLEDGFEDFGWTGVKCEVKTCGEASTETVEVNDDEVRNVCLLHWRFIQGWQRGLRRVRMRVCWDDGTTEEFGK